MPGRALGAETLILLARAIGTGVTIACGAAVLHAMTVGRDAFPLAPTAVVLVGVTLVLITLLRERGTVRQSSGLVAVVVVASVAWGIGLAARAPDVLAVMTRLIGFALLGEAYLWRTLGVARGQQRWLEVRSDALLALLGVVVASVVPGAVDRDALPVLGLAVAFSGAVGLSLARSTEELALASGQIRGTATPAAATGTAFALGVLVLVVGIALPALQALAVAAARAVGPFLGDALFTILLPLGYVAAYVVLIAQWLRDLLHPGALDIRIPGQPFSAEDEARRLREMEETRPFIFGAVEVLIAIVAVGLALVLISRLIQERRALLPSGVAVERERVEGIGLRATLGALFPRRRARPRPPAEDGTPATSLRRVYWAFLDLAEREGPGRRDLPETPAEHEQRLLRVSRRWEGAGPIVRAFESLRYGEVDPDPRTVASARAALRQVEAAR